ncbi:MAG: serine hydrolase domain-containing protein [Pseudomonadota bacterium]|nr:serine hydrolase domain-containing protein [Pseudomonadota bacterium]
MRVIFTFLILLLSHTVAAASLEDSVRTYQEALITHGVTGSNIAGVFKGSEVLALSAVASDLPGDQPITEETIFPIWSMSKPVTIVAMMVLLDQGKYSVDEPVAKYLPEFGNLMCRPADDDADLYPCEKELLIDHLLTHRSGYSYYGNGGGEGPDFRFPFADLEDYMRHVASWPLEFEPGTSYLYGINQAILGRLVEVLSGKTFYGFLYEAIFAPLGMKDTKFELTDADRLRLQPLYRKPQLKSGLNGIAPDEGTPRITDQYDELDYAPGTQKQLGGEGLVSTFSDYRKFCEMLLNGGQYNGQTILSKASLDLMTTTVTPPQLSGGYSSGFGYAYSVFNLVEPALDGTGSPEGIFCWSGYHNTHFWIDPTNGIYGLFKTRTTPFSFEIQKHFRAAVYGAFPASD